MNLLFSVCLAFAVCNVFAADMKVPGFDDPANWRQYAGAKIECCETGKIVFSGPGAATIRFNEDIRQTQVMKKYNGLAFRVKGDGGVHRLSIRLNESVFCHSLRIDGTEQRDIVIPWRDFVNVSHDPSIVLGQSGTDGMPPESISHLVLGDWWKITHRNEQITPFRLEITDLRFVEDTPPPVQNANKTFGSVSTAVRKMKTGKRVLIYCCGDSITAGTRVGEKRYANLLQMKLRTHFGNDQIDVQTLAVGGASSANLREWCQYDFSGGEKPDIVTLMAGYNDRSGGVTADAYKSSMRELADRINAAAPGAALILFATAPGAADRYDFLDSYAQCIREIAAELNLPCFDLNAILKSCGREGMLELFADRAHPNEAGHQLIAQKLFQFILDQENL